MTSPADPDGFPAVTLEDWAAAVTADLGPDALARRLRFFTEDGLALDALGTGPAGVSAVGEAVSRLVLHARAGNPYPGAWGVRQRLDAALAQVADVRDACAGGADSIEVDLSSLDAGAMPARVHVLAAPAVAAGCEVALHGLPATTWEAVLPALAASGAAVSAGIDPCTTWLASGAAGDLSPRVAELARLLPHVRAGYRGRLLRASSAAWFDAGATVGWSLALALASALEYVQVLRREGVAHGDAVAQLELELALGADLFEGIAAVRAARLVWSRALEVIAPGASASLRLVVTAGTRTFSRRDPWTNALRETAAAFAGAVGGADLVGLPPFDVRSGASPAAHRLVRNTPLILREEAGLTRVADPAAGSWYLDAATGALAERVWSMLGEIDAAGGLAQACASGLVQQRLEAQRGARATAVRTRRRPIIGVSEFRDRTVRHPAIAAHRTPPPSRFGAPADAEPFERLQDAADSFAVVRRARARVLLVRLGTPADAAPRVAFARSVLEAGGLDPVVADGDVAPGVLAGSFTTSGASTAILCGSDAGYAAAATTAAATLKAAEARLVLLAGRPGADAETLRAAGVDDFVFTGADVVGVLERVLRAAGVLP